MFNLIKKLLNTKIRSKLIAMCIVVIVPVFAAGVYLIFNTTGIIQQSVVDEAFNDAENMKSRLRDTIYTNSTAAENVYYNDEINYLLNNNFTSEEEYREFYRSHSTVEDYLKMYSQFMDIVFYVDIDGFVYNSDYRRVTGEVSNSYWYKAANSDRPVWQVIRNPGDGNFYLSYVRRVYRRGDPVGAMVISITPEWIDGLMKDEIFKVVFCVQEGMVFYSNMDNYELGKVCIPPEISFKPGISDSVELTEMSPLTKEGYTIASCFDYENTGNLFQIYLVKPYSIVTGSTKNFTEVYVWYVSLCFLLSMLITILFTTYFVRRIKLLQDQMHKVAMGDFSLDADIKGGDEINDLYRDLQVMVASMESLINEAYEAKIQSETFKFNQMEAEFKTLASQINPHFLYNTLETIRMKAYVNNDKETADLIKKLGKFMRRCLEVKDGMVTLKSELEFTKSYLELQSARFGDRVSYSVNCEVDPEYKILPLIIQPIVENAFIHGIESSKTKGVITINAFYKFEDVIIDVIDNGQGIPDDKMSELLWKLEENDTSSGKSIGLTNVNKRIKMYHGEKYGLSVTSGVGKGTRVRITLPDLVRDDVTKREVIEKNVK